MEQAPADGATAFIEAVEGVLAGCGYPAGLRRAWRLAFGITLPPGVEVDANGPVPGL
ncbi:hypothetical protein ABZ883_34640 [Streptomyces sp. NPDC046977]|uniref:hypothetical protein n=1 Tax=Streptomyces sp. NPDC046977 TaxID=3154703 RepID=UPI0033F64D24